MTLTNQAGLALGEDVAQLRHTVDLEESISWRVLCDSMMNIHVTLGIWLSVTMLAAPSKILMWANGLQS